MRWTSAAASGGARRSCAPATANSKLMGDRTASSAASIVLASLKSTLARTPRTGLSSSPIRPYREAGSKPPARGRAYQADRLQRKNAMRRRRRIKIIATLGPASADRATIASLFAAGADVFRINMSHASHDAMRERVALIRSLEEQFDRPIGILVDLQGPKLRVGMFANDAEDLHKGAEFALDA